MSRKMLSVPGCAALSACLLLILVGSQATAQEENLSLKGEIEAAEYDDDGNVTSTMVYDPEWGSVLVSSTGKGRELLKHVGAVAKITGKVVELDDESGYSYEITVTAYTIVEPAGPARPEEEEENDWDPDK